MENDRADINFQGRWISFLRTHQIKITDIKRLKSLFPLLFRDTLYMNKVTDNTLCSCVPSKYDPSELALIKQLAWSNSVFSFTSLKQFLSSLLDLRLAQLSHSLIFPITSLAHFTTVTNFTLDKKLCVVTIYVASVIGQ